jgi:hypothetical protein
MALVFDLVDPQELVGYVRGVQLEQERNRFTLAAFLPNRNIDEIEYRITQGTLQMAESATVRAWDTESPIGSRQGLRRMFGELPPMSRKIRLGEEERLRKRKLETGDGAPIVNAIYDDAANMAGGVAARVERFRGEALQTGKIAINENGVEANVDFGRRTDFTVTAPVKWDVDGSDPISYLQALQELYNDENGETPGYLLTSRKVLTTLLANTAVRGYVGRGSYVPGSITIPDLNAVLDAYDLPPIVTYDTKVRVGGAQVRVTNQKMATFLPANAGDLGNTTFGTTAEALDLTEARAIANDQAPGMVAVVLKTDEPVATWTKAVAVGLPLIANPNLTLTSTVLT